VEEMMAQGLNVLLDIDTQGAINVMENASDYVSVFILPPSFTELENRLRGRNTDEPDVIERRLRNAREEVKMLDRYQYAIVNDDLEQAYERLKHIVNAEKLSTKRCKPAITE